MLPLCKIVKGYSVLQFMAIDSRKKKCYEKYIRNIMCYEEEKILYPWKTQKRRRRQRKLVGWL